MANVIKEFECEECGIFEKLVKHTTRSKKCPKCSQSCDSIISLPAISKMGDPRTLGSLMEKNGKKNPLSKEKALGSEEDLRKQEQSGKLQKIGRMSDSQKEHYIKTGKMP